MKRPTWATAIGIIGIVIGSFGVLGSVQSMMMPMMVEFQKSMISTMQDAIEKENASSPHATAPPVEFFKFFEKMLDVPEWFGTWCVVAGLSGLCVSVLYIFGSIRLLQLKRIGITLFYWANGLSIAQGLIGCMLAASLKSFVSMFMVAGSAFGIAISVVLILVVTTGDKEEFAAPQSH